MGVDVADPRGGPKKGATPSRVYVYTLVRFFLVSSLLTGSYLIVDAHTRVLCIRRENEGGRETTTIRFAAVAPSLLPFVQGAAVRLIGLKAVGVSAVLVSRGYEM